jgi:hypothetical protein
LLTRLFRILCTREEDLASLFFLVW